LASITKRLSGSYQARIYIGSVNGKNITKSVTRRTLKECKKAARILEEKLKSDRRQFIEEYFHSNNPINLITINCIINGIQHQMYYKKTPEDLEKAIRDLEMLFKAEV
jgi:hypothetical protein